MNYISSLFISKLISSNNIIDIISSKVNLKKVGKYYKSYCPFHNEKNPSFIVNKDKQFFYCFGCKSNGNVIDFLMKINNYNFLDAIKELSNISGIPILYNNNIFNTKIINKDRFFKLMFNLNKIYIKSLLINYNFYIIKNFFINRNINYKCILNFSIGYSYNLLVNKFINSLSYNNRYFLFKLGILIKNKYGNFYDRLFNRIIFPIYNLYGDIIAFGGRSIINNNFSKYINSSNNMFFTKGYNLYNFNNIIKKKNKLKKILIVEGYIDVIMLYKFGINYSVALLGSNISKQQIKILYFYTNKVILCLDGDKSNFSYIKNIIKLLISFINNKKMFFIVFLPYGEDPDSLIQKEGKILFEKRLNNSLSIIDILLKYYFLKKNLLTCKDKISFINSLLPYISKINCSIIKYFIKIKILNKIGIFDKYNLNNLLYYNFNKKNIKVKFTLLRCLISLLLKYPILSNKVNLYDRIFNYNINNSIPGLVLFLDIVNICINNKNINIIKIISKFNNNINIKNYLIKLFLWNFFPKNINYNLIFSDALIKLKFFIIKNILKKILLNNNNLYELSLNKKIIIWNLIKFKKLNN